MLVKHIEYEDFVNYKKPSMFIATCFCDWKCPRELGIDISVCQNQKIAQMPNMEIPVDEIFRRYSINPITSAIVIGGLEPFLQIGEVLELIEHFRCHGCRDDIVVYTGHTEHEVSKHINILGKFPDIIVKFGRFISGHDPHFDETLGVNLVSDNQYALKIS